MAEKGKTGLEKVAENDPGLLQAGRNLIVSLEDTLRDLKKRGVDTTATEKRLKGAKAALDRAERQLNRVG